LLEVIEKLGSDPVALVAWAEQATATDYASLAPVALTYAEAGDRFAEQIVTDVPGRLTCSFVPWWNLVRPESL
jgi:glucosamine kinase